MTDYSELKRLAEGLALAIEQAEHKPGQWATTGQSMGGICDHGTTFQIGNPWPREEPWASFSYKRDSWLAVAAVNALPSMLALIAENERLGLESHNTRIILVDMVESRDQLKAENEALRKRIDDMSPFKGAPLTGPGLKCLACGGYHYGMSGLPCPKMAPMAQGAKDD